MGYPPLPQNPVSTGMTGHEGDHDNIAAALALIEALLPLPVTIGDVLTGTGAGAAAWQPATGLPTLAEVSVSASGTLALNKITEVTATSGALTMTLPSSVANSLIVCERASASTQNVAVTGNIRGVSSSTITLQLASESEMFFGDGTTWWPVAGHKTLASLQALFLQVANNLSDLASASTARTNLGLGTAAVLSTPIPASDLSGVVTGVTAGDASIVVGGTSAAPTVETGTLDQVASLHGAASAVSMNSQRVTNVATPTASTDAVNKAYADAIASGLSPKPSCRVATTGSETYTITSGSVTQISGTTVDGISPAIGDRVLIKDAPASSGAGSAFSTEPGNGTYMVTGNTTNLTVARATDMSGSEAPQGAFVFTEAGTVNAAAGFVVTTPSAAGSFTYGSGNIAWTQFSGAGEITAGTGLSKSGNTLSLSTPVSIANGGTGQASQQAALDALAGAQTAAQVLAGNGTHVTLRALAAGDLPAATGSAQGAVEFDATTPAPTGTAGAAGVATTVPRRDHAHAQNYGGVFGDGSDGAVTLDGSTTYNGFSSLASSTYTLTRDVYATNLTVNNTVTLAPAGYRIFCQGTFTNNGTVTVAGGAGGANGAAGGAGGGSGTVSAGKTGGAGQTAAGSAGISTNGAGVNTAGSGGTGSSAGGSGGTSGATGSTWFKTPAPVLCGLANVAGTTSAVTGGPGGGGGGGDGTNKGGGGGGGGGVVVILAWAATNSGTINASGGAGGTPTAGNTGGGGGGSGGLILVYTLSAWTAGTTNVAGGALGSPHGTGTNNATAGGSGSVLNQVVA